MTKTSLTKAHTQGPKDAEGHTAGCVACPECQRERQILYAQQARERSECPHCQGAGEYWVYDAREYEMVRFVNGPAQVTDGHGTRSLVTCICVRRGQ